jgi:hypothetical protein
MFAGTAWSIDYLLRGAPPGGRRLRAFELLAVIWAFGLLYGAGMGTYGGLGDGRSLQVLYSAIKVPLLLLGTFVLSVPSFFVLNTLLGVRSDFHGAMRAVLSAQGVLTVVLAALTPLTLLWYVSVRDYPSAILFNAAMFAVASVSAQIRLRRAYAGLIQRNPRHRNLMRAWLGIYAFVGIQMGWLLRPFIGDPGAPTTFFRPDTWGNAYVIVLRMIWELLT